MRLKVKRKRFERRNVPEPSIFTPVTAAEREALQGWWNGRNAAEMVHDRCRNVLDEVIDVVAVPRVIEGPYEPPPEEMEVLQRWWEEKCAGADNGGGHGADPDRPAR